MFKKMLLTSALVLTAQMANATITCGASKRNANNADLYDVAVGAFMIEQLETNKPYMLHQNNDLFITVSKAKEGSIQLAVFQSNKNVAHKAYAVAASQSLPISLLDGINGYAVYCSEKK